MSDTPTGREHRTGVKIRGTSATERAVFRSCRRKWLLTTVHRLGMTEGNGAFMFGTAMHTGLAAYYRALQAGQDRSEATTLALEAYGKDWSDAIDALREDLGFLWPHYAEHWADMGDLGVDMLTRYDYWDQAHPLVSTVTAVEERFEVPIPGLGGGVLSCQLDLEGEDDDGELIADHKNLASAPRSTHLDIDDQLTAYIWAKLKHDGHMVNRAVYNALLKKRPHPPKENKPKKDGTRVFSQDKSQITTVVLYREALEMAGVDPAPYEEHLAWLAENEPELFVREEVFRTKGQMRNFEHNLQREWKDMRQVAMRPDLAYPNPSAFNCGSCPVRAICTMMMDDGDVESVIKSQYHVLPPRW